MSSVMLTLLVVFIAYAGLVTWQMRLAIRTKDPRERLVRARALLLLVSLGIPIALAFIYYASPGGTGDPRVP